jgi:hypothetical protein
MLNTMLRATKRDEHGFYTVPVKYWIPYLDQEPAEIPVKVFGQFGGAMLFVWVDDQLDKKVIQMGICRQSTLYPNVAVKEGEVTLHSMTSEGELEELRRRLDKFGFGNEVYTKIFNVFAQQIWRMHTRGMEGSLPDAVPVSFIND